MTAADFDRALIDALGTPTAVELERELALLAALDAHRQRTPVWLLDIDGVVNVITRKPNKAVWSLEEWQSGNASNRGGTWPIHWAVPVVDFIRNVHESGWAEIRWHTTWQDDSQRFADLVGLPEFPIAEAPEFERPTAYAAEAIREGRPDWWKLPAAERVVRDEKRPLIWTDDDITWSLKRYDRAVGLEQYAPTLLVSPHEETGLTRKQLRQISDFIAHRRLEAGGPR